MSAVSSGWNEASSSRPSRTSTGLAGVLGEHLDAGPDVAYSRRTDEDAVQRLGLAGELESRLEAGHLAPVGVPFDLEVGEPQVLAVEHDHPRAGAEDGPVEAANRLLEPVETYEPHDRRRLAAGDDEPIETVELLGQADLDHLCAEAAQHARVLPKCSLHRQDTDARPLLHATNSRNCTRANRLACRGERVDERGET